MVTAGDNPKMRGNMHGGFNVYENEADACSALTNCMSTKKVISSKGQKLKVQVIKLVIVDKFYDF